MYTHTYMYIHTYIQVCRMLIKCIDIKCMYIYKYVIPW